MNHITKIAALLGFLMLILSAIPSTAAIPCSLKVGEYPGSSEKEGREDTSDVYAVDHEIIQPIDPATGMATGVRQHKALTVLKLIDKATPGFNKACCTGQNLAEVVLDFYRIDPATRQEMKYYTITLKQARIVSVKVMVPTTLDPAYESYGHMEEVRFVYEEIEWNWLPDSIVEMDRWRSPSAASTSTTDKETTVKTDVESSRPIESADEK